ncbi:MAG: hypothetical protein NTW62_00010 [Candidatus Nomurabacteria bacterium]|nr:hypothetical protein [Candidatus Nomurabacteria bacterium]
MQPVDPVGAIGNNPLFSPTYINLEYIFNKIYEFFNTIFSTLFGNGNNTASNSGNVANQQGLSNFHVLLLLLCVFFIIIIIYCIVRIFEIRKLEDEYMDNEIAIYASKHGEKEKYVPLNNERWENVLKYLHSQNPSDWRVAIIEADLILEDMTKQIGLQGLNLGDRLKSANRDKFKTLDDAWEAHLVRNKIAHDGTKFEVHQREAQRVIYLYEKVFQEFGII